MRAQILQLIGNIQVKDGGNVILTVQSDPQPEARLLGVKRLYRLNVGCCCMSQ